MNSNKTDRTEFLGKKISGPFTIPSGIVATAVPIIEYIFSNIPQIGVLTTKSIGLDQRLGYREPVFNQYEPGCFINAIGLTNPGAAKSADLFARLNVPSDKFFLVSIFGGSVEEFVRVAEILAPYADGLELNLSCPHAKGYGMAMGQDSTMVGEITAAVKSVVDIPVIPKLTPNVDDISEIAEAAAASGADAVCAINTVGPRDFYSHGQLVLSNGEGGISGKEILPIGVDCVQKISDKVNVPIIGCGGISSSDDVRAYRKAGATIFGIGSALTGMTSREITNYFSSISSDLSQASSQSNDQARYDLDMEFRPVNLVRTERITSDISILSFDGSVDIKAGEFIFLWIPGLGEKPFSVLTNDPFSLVVIDLGEFTHELVALEPGTKAYIRGPYGQRVEPPSDADIVAVAGGTGLAAVFQIAKDFGNANIFIGARSSERLYFQEECAAIASLHIATDDGSLGYSGLVTELLEKYLNGLSSGKLRNTYFYNCGPSPMVSAAIEVEKQFANNGQIFSAVDYLTKCGVGICGACAAPNGQRICVDGPFLNP